MQASICSYSKPVRLSACGCDVVAPLIMLHRTRTPQHLFRTARHPGRARHARRNTTVAAGSDPEPQPYRSLDKRQLGLRSEAEAPYRSLRVVLFGFQVLSAGVAFVIGSTQLASALANAPRHLPLQEVAQGLAIDAAGIGIFGWLLKRDLDARDKQIARMTREEDLGSLQIELANKKTLRLAQLRQFVRIVIVAGTSQQVQDALEEAEEFREPLEERGVMVIPLPIFEGSNAEKDKQNQLTDKDLKWKATALRQGDWANWFETQMKTANKKPEKGLYISLRMDGRVRGSGTGSPPWDRLAVALPPVSGPGAWGGLLDGFDGSV